MELKEAPEKKKRKRYDQCHTERIQVKQRLPKEMEVSERSWFQLVNEVVGGRPIKYIEICTIPRVRARVMKVYSDRSTTYQNIPYIIYVHYSLSNKSARL